MERALLRLPVEQRAVVVAVDMQGYSVAETARLLGRARGHGQESVFARRARLAESLDYLSRGELLALPHPGVRARDAAEPGPPLTT